MKVFLENPEAAKLHARGLEDAISGQFDSAHKLFAEASTAVGPVGDSSIVQLARITRDEGFTFVREAIASDKPVPKLAHGSYVLDRSSSYLKGLIINDSSSSDERAQINAELGATISCLGRLANVAEYLFGNQTFSTDPEDPSMNHFVVARSHLWQGNNGYYLTSNSVMKVREERLSGGDDAGKWLAEARSNLAWTIKNDPSNIKAARKTTLRGITLVSRPIALRSLRNRP